MRLLNVRSRRLEEFFDKPVPDYAILSHTWGEHEIVYQDFQQSDHLLRLLREVQVLSLSPTQSSQKPALSQSRLRNETTLDSLKPHSTPSRYVKIDGCCAQAIKDGCRYVWIDTICIDKSSSAELSEAINSMYKWYANGLVCYVYLSDVRSTFDPQDELGSADFRKSRWFTRGWTLQELLAPSQLVFFTSSWSEIAMVDKDPWSWSAGDRPHDSMLSLLTTITKIPRVYLSFGKRLQDAPVCQRMAWSAHRQTTRPEDEAYCLLGLFDINMPLLYGEGRKAFMRLQQQLMQVAADDTLFCWGRDAFAEPDSYPDVEWSGLLAKSPSWFSGLQSTSLKLELRQQPSHYMLTNRGVLLTLPRTTYGDTPFDSEMLVIPLNVKTASGKCLALPLRLDEQGSFQRLSVRTPFEISRLRFRGLKSQVTYIQPTGSFTSNPYSLPVVLEIPKAIGPSSILVTDIYPPYVTCRWRYSRQDKHGNRRRLALYVDSNVRPVLERESPFTLVIAISLYRSESAGCVGRISLLWRIVFEEYWPVYHPGEKEDAISLETGYSRVPIRSQGLYHCSEQRYYSLEDYRAASNRTMQWQAEVRLPNLDSRGFLSMTGDGVIRMAKISTRIMDECPPPEEPIVLSMTAEEVQDRYREPQTTSNPPEQPLFEQTLSVLSDYGLSTWR